jgi:hypothetical protein
LRDQTEFAANFEAGVPVSLLNSSTLVVPAGHVAWASAGCGLFVGVVVSSVARVAWWTAVQLAAVKPAVPPVRSA